MGINTAILSRTGGNNGVGFAIPSNMARSVMNDLITVDETRPAFAKPSLEIKHRLPIPNPWISSTREMQKHPLKMPP